MQKGLVSIITPAYNTGGIIHRLMDSILQQDYPLVEMFVINDGSTDDTESIIESYIPQFSKRGYILTYRYQKNSGQSVAIQHGLRLVNGEYLIWPDSDDYYNDPQALSKFVKVFLENNSVSVVRCYPRYVDEISLQEQYRICDDEIHHKEDLFLDSLLCSNGFFWGAGNYMVKMKDLDDAIPNRNIYTEKSIGQNWQLISPVLYRRKCITLNEHFINILLRMDSHSRGQFVGFSKTLEKESLYEKTILETIDRIPQLTPKEKDYYSIIVRKKYAIDNMNFCIHCKNPQEALYYADKYNNLSPDKLDKYTVLMCKYCKAPIIYAALRILRKLFYK